MLDTSIAVVSIFLLVPALIAFFAVRGYKNIVRRERAEAAKTEAEAEARRAAAENLGETAKGGGAGRPAAGE